MAVNQNCSAADTCEQNLHGYGPHPDLKTVAPIKYYVKEFGQVGTDNTTALAREAMMLKEIYARASTAHSTLGAPLRSRGLPRGSRTTLAVVHCTGLDLT